MSKEQMAIRLLAKAFHKPALPTGWQDEVQAFYFRDARHWLRAQGYIETTDHPNVRITTSGREAVVAFEREFGTHG